MMPQRGGFDAGMRREDVIRNQTTLYVGCSLTHATDTFKSSVERFKSALREEGYEVFDFLGLARGTSRDVYEWDIGHCVKDCDIFVAICDQPGIGLGWELGEATRLGKPVLVLAHTNAVVTRLVLGAVEAEPNVQFERYDDLLDMVSIVKAVAPPIDYT
jgi:nucleoside 2-deoxyribosyltransferase